MSKLVIYDDKNILIADLDKTDKRIVKSKKEIKGVPVNYIETIYAAYFKDYKLISSQSAQKEIKKLEKRLKYHKEDKKWY